MANLILFDDPTIRKALLPFTFTRPVAGIRIGIQTLAEKWGDSLSQTPSFLTESYLQPKFPQIAGSDNWYVNGAICPTPALQEAIPRWKWMRASLCPMDLYWPYVLIVK